MRFSATRLLIRDELVGFAKSKVMIVLWVVLPLLATLGYFLLSKASVGGDNAPKVPMTYMMALWISGLAGTIAAVMVSVDLVSERMNSVYDLFVIRPMPRDAILWAKFASVFFCVTIACVVSLSIGLAVDTIRGVKIDSELLEQTLRSLGSVIGVIAISAAVGVFFGVISNSILVAVILILYVGQNLTIIPMIPALFKLGDTAYWIILAITAVMTMVVMFFACLLFRRAEL